MTPEQIQDLIAQALQPLQDEIAALREKVASLEALQEQDVTRIYTDIAQDRKRIAKLREMQPRMIAAQRAYRLAGMRCDRVRLLAEVEKTALGRD